ncbi:S53 family peptidase [Fodinicola feengrottensis]|uniref:S53 family peptidase n=1 Tax=Fodinicola feengrottensis TaxID=435914 RepID=UPI0031DDCE50
MTLAMGLLGAISAAPAYSATPPATSAKQGYRQACTARSGNYFHCLTLIAPRHANGKSPQAAAAKPDGLGVQDLRKAYQLPQNPPAGATVAIAIAFHSPTLESDLNTYRKQYGLSACTVANRCLTVLNQNGDATPVPENDPGWEVEETLDVSMVSASCPSCRIVVVEATDDSFNNLAAATVMAGQHATVVSNSYGGPENGLAQQFAGAYDQPNHQVVVSSGDDGFTKASFPATVASVIAVGGTELTKADNTRGFTESTWADGSSGCSAYVAKPARQHDPHCSMRTVADVSAVADNVSMFNAGNGGWFDVAGTSVAAPFIAGMYGQVNNNATVDTLYQHPESFNDITTGANDHSGTGADCGNDYLCTAQPGYDAPTGVGSPIGLAAF